MNDWVKQRFGLETAILAALIALMYLFISICAEYTSVVLLINTLVPGARAAAAGKRGGGDQGGTMGARRASR